MYWNATGTSFKAVQPRLTLTWDVLKYDSKEKLKQKQED